MSETTNQRGSLLGSLLEKVLLLDLLRGLLVTLKYTLRPKVTIRYPEQVKPPRARFRGLLRLHRNEQGEPLCVACKMCQRACPENCFAIEGVRAESGKMAPVRFDWNLARCTFCGLCVEACPTDAIRFGAEFRLATSDPSRLRFTMEQMDPQFDVQACLLGEEPQ